MDRSVVRDLDTDARAYQCTFRDFFRIQSGLECLLPTGDIDNGRAPLSINREINERRRIIQNHRLLKPSSNRNENTQQQDFEDAIGLVFESQILCAPIDQRKREDISAGLGPDD